MLTDIVPAGQPVSDVRLQEGSNVKTWELTGWFFLAITRAGNLMPLDSNNLF